MFFLVKFRYSVKWRVVEVRGVTIIQAALLNATAASFGGSDYHTTPNYNRFFVLFTLVLSGSGSDGCGWDLDKGPQGEEHG